jgi:(2S)-methylsuccinyl-CoA dehydrogenase
LTDTLDLSLRLIDRAFGRIAGRGGPDVEQATSYDVIHAYAGVQIARSFLDYAAIGEDEADLVLVFGSGAVRAAINALVGRQTGIEDSEILDLVGFLDDVNEVSLAAAVAESPGGHHLPPDYELVRETFARVAAEVVGPVAGHVHRTDDDIPEEVIHALAGLGAFGMSIDAEFGGFAEAAEQGMLATVIATEELSRASLAVGGSLLTRPEIIIRALERGGMEAQKREFLPRIASGDALVAVAVTEPDHGSDVAGLRMTATRDGEEWVLNGVKTWCTFAGRAHLLMVLARTGPGEGHRGLSLFLVEKESSLGHHFRQEQPGGGLMEGTAIPTLGYRGMHSFEVSFDGWRVPSSALVGGDVGIGGGFLLQMAGFESGRLQTAARAVGVMQRAYDEAKAYAAGRSVFSKPLAEYELTRVKLGRMAATIQACRQFTYAVATKLGADDDSGAMAAMVKAYACRAAEWITREAMQIHGGYGYAEEYPVSRLFVDARVLSIFEGADEVLALRVIGRRLMAAGG